MRVKKQQKQNNPAVKASGERYVKLSRDTTSQPGNFSELQAQFPTQCHLDKRGRSLSARSTLFFAYLNDIGSQPIVFELMMELEDVVGDAQKRPFGRDLRFAPAPFRLVDPSKSRLILKH